MSNTFKILNYFDLLGVEPLFFVNEKVRFKSLSGGIQTLILLIILLVVFCIEIDKYLHTTNPQDLEVIDVCPVYQTIFNKSNFFWLILFLSKN